MVVTDILSSADLARARALLEAQGLRFEPGSDDLVGVFAGEALVAVGARAGDVLRTIAIDPAEQGGPLLGAIVGELARRGHAAGHASLFVYTKPEHVPSFEALNFALLAAGGRAALLESGGGLERWLEAHRAKVHPGANGAVVVNANPFTLGHRHLVERAAGEVDALYVLVVREDRSAFPFEVRLRLVREGTRDLPNVRVLDTSRYAVSAVTFPSYFLKRPDDAPAIQIELDLLLFARRIAPAFHVRRRYFGTEPTCETTRAYAEGMRRLLPRHGIEAIEIPRREAGGRAISASSVRAALREGDLAAALRLVPPPTAAYLRSDAAGPVLARLRGEEGRHG